MKPYPEYKDSGVQWLDKLPATWSISRGKGIFRVIDIRSATGDEELLTVSSSDGVVPRSQKTVTMFMAESYVGHKLCWPGDLVINSLWAWMQGLGFARHHGLVSSAYSVYRPKTAYTEYWRFFHYLLRSAAYKWELQTRSKGVWLSRLQLSDAAFLDMPIVIPPIEDVLAIVRYIDHANWRIDRYIRAKRKLIALLKEQKQAIIQQAVTHGLEPNVRLKPSGVEWLGDVPEHWERRRLKTVLTPVDQRSSTGKETLLSLRRDHGIVIFADHFTRPPQGATMIGFKIVEIGQIVVNRLQANNGLIFRSSLRGLVSPDYSVFDAKSPIDMEYLATLLRTALYRAHFRRESTGLGTGTAGFLRLYDDRLLETIVWLPPLQEQSQILASIDSEAQEIIRLVERAQLEIDLIREYRTRLIADVVTGKIDVRETAQQLPAETIEPEMLDEEGEDIETKELETVAED
ncbi:hypothetical protein ANRL4_03047 [Anaerolineae bacterium]|nr:hypothetical protein ANRL4_03047 [Anaerolineae bacterium]